MLLNADGTAVRDGSVIDTDGRVVVGNEYLDDQVAGSLKYQFGISRPYIEDRPNHPYRGRECVRLQQGMKYNNQTKEYEPRYREFRVSDLQRRGINSPVWNANALPRMTWVQMLSEVVEVFRERLTVYASIRAGGTVPGVDPYRSATIEYEAMSDPGEVIEDMDVISDGRTDSPLFKTRSKPITVIYGNFHFSDRRLRISQAGGRNLSTIMHRALTRRIAERVENNTIGNNDGVTFGTLTGNYANAHDGTSTDYGLINHPQRITMTTMTDPSSGTFVAETTYNEVITAINTMRTNKFYGPYKIFFGTDWFPYLSRVFSISGGNHNNETLLSMIQKLPNVSSVEIADLLDGYTMVIVNAQGETVQAVDAMQPTLLQWDSMGGAKRNFRVIASQSVLFRYDYNGTLGVLHGTTS